MKNTLISKPIKVVKTSQAVKWPDIQLASKYWTSLASKSLTQCLSIQVMAFKPD